MTTELKIDDIDESIITMLSEDGRRSNSQIGRDLGLSEGAIRKRLKRLIAGGAISYGLVVDVEATGMVVSGWLEVEAHPQAARAVGGLISAKPCCEFCCLTTGTASIRAFVYLDSFDALNRLTREILQHPGVLDLRFRSVVGHAQHRYGMIYLTDN